MNYTQLVYNREFCIQLVYTGHELYTVSVKNQSPNVLGNPEPSAFPENIDTSVNRVSSCFSVIKTITSPLSALLESRDTRLW